MECNYTDFVCLATLRIVKFITYGYFDTIFHSMWFRIAATKMY